MAGPRLCVPLAVLIIAAAAVVAMPTPADVAAAYARAVGPLFVTGIIVHQLGERTREYRRKSNERRKGNRGGGRGGGLGWEGKRDSH
jgi:hypothetical protein